MREAFPGDDELVEFFGVNPVVQDPLVPWDFNTLTFTVDRDGDRLTCTIVPALIVIDMRWTRAGADIVHVAVAEISEVTIAAAAGRRSLRASAAPGVLALQLWLDPHIRLYAGNGFRE